jgi:hypothetical protein
MDAALVDHTIGRVSGSSAESASQGNRRSLHPNAGLRQPPDGTKRMSASDRMRLLHGLLDLRTRAVVEPRADMRGACNSRDPIRGPGSGHREIRRPVVDAGQNVAMKIDHKFEKFVHRTPNRAKLAAASRQIYDRKVKKNTLSKVNKFTIDSNHESASGKCDQLVQRRALGNSLAEML